MTLTIMVDIVQLFINAAVLSAFYALVAIGFTMIFGVADILNLAHGAAIIIGGFAAFYTVRAFGLSIWVGAVASVLAAGLFSVLVYYLFVKRIEDDPIFVVIITLVLLLITEEFFLVMEGAPVVTIPSLVSGSLTIANATVQYNSLLTFVVSWLVIGGLFFLTNRTWVGRGIHAMSQTKRGATLVGINHERTTRYTYAIAGGLAGLAGLFFGISQGVGWDMGLDPLLMAFAITIVGGMGSIKGSVVGAYIVGTLETITTTMIDPRMTGIVALTILLVVIIVRPQGLYGRPEVS